MYLLVYKLDTCVGYWSICFLMKIFSVSVCLLVYQFFLLLLLSWFQILISHNIIYFFFVCCLKLSFNTLTMLKSFL